MAIYNHFNQRTLTGPQGAQGSAGPQGSQGEQGAQGVSGVIARGASLGISSSYISTSQATSSTTYTDLATVGPSVTVSTGTSALVFMSFTLTQNSSGVNTGYMSFAVSGATTIAASDSNSVGVSSPYSLPGSAATVVHLTNLTSGSNTFTAKYRCNAGGPFNFIGRSITVIPL